MKVNSIQTSGYLYNHTQKNNFTGYVNGNYYNDKIIEAAKKAIKNANWEKEMQAKKSSFFKDYLETLNEDIPLRILAGIVSFGSTEVIIAATCAAEALEDNTEENINQIKNCIIDILKSRK